MFIGESGGGLKVRENTSTGLWAVHISTPQFWAWKYWLEDQFRYTRAIHGKWLTVWDQWPPMTAGRASSIAQYISDMRDELGNSKPVPRRPTPWDGAVPTVPEEHRGVAA